MKSYIYQKLKNYILWYGLIGQAPSEPYQPKKLINIKEKRVISAWQKTAREAFRELFTRSNSQSDCIAKAHLLNCARFRGYPSQG